MIYKLWNKFPEIHFVQHLNKASLDYCAQVGIWTPEKKQKFKIHNGSVSEIVLFTVHFQDKSKKKSSKYALGVL